MKVTVITKPLYTQKERKRGPYYVKEFYYANRIEDGKRTAYSIMSNPKGK